MSKQTTGASDPACRSAKSTVRPGDEVGPAASDTGVLPAGEEVSVGSRNLTSIQKETCQLPNIFFNELQRNENGQNSRLPTLFMPLGCWNFLGKVRLPGWVNRRDGKTALRKPRCLVMEVGIDWLPMKFELKKLSPPNL